MSTEELLAAALALPLAQRAELTEKLAGSLEGGPGLSPEEWDAAWTAEVDRRMNDIDSDRVELIDDAQIWADVDALLAATPQ